MPYRAAAVWILMSATVCLGQGRVNLTAAQREEALSLVTQSESFDEARDDERVVALDGERVLCEVLAYREDGDDAAIVVTTYHFDYRDGSTIRSIANLRTDTSQSVRIEGYSPALAPDERLRALQLSLEDPEVRALYESQQNPRAYFLPSVIVDRDNDLLGHRVVEVQHVSGPNNSIRSTFVDLTTRAVLDAARFGRVAVGLDDVLAGSSIHTVEHAFPLDAPNEEKQTAWRVTFGVEQHGAGEILFIKEASFQRVRNGPWLQVLGDCRLVEMFVPYNNGTTRYYDITSVGGSLRPLHVNDLGPRCLGTPKLHLNDKVAVEFHDSRTLWLDHYLPSDQQSRRGEEMHIWAVLPTGNYCYPILYSFRSDGSVGFLVSATAHNLFNTKDDLQATHLHMGCWRLNVTLDDQSQTAIETVRFKSSPALGAKAETEVVPFNANVEGGIEWSVADLLRLRVTSNVVFNDHAPPARVSYELIPNYHQGRGRTYGVGEDWTHKDLWVTLPVSREGALQDRFRELPNYVRAPRTTSGRAAVIWCKATLVHRARDEDFGKSGYDRSQGVALTSWVGYDLVPRNVHAKTPLYP